MVSIRTLDLFRIIRNPCANICISMARAYTNNSTRVAPEGLKRKSSYSKQESHNGGYWSLGQM